MQTVTQDEATVNLTKIVDDAIRQGQEVVVMRNNIAVAKIVTLPQPDASTDVVLPRQPVSARGLIHMRENFEVPLDDFAEYR